MALIIRTTGVEDYLSGGSGRIKCLIMGNPGVGKTPHAARWPKPILADCEEGRMSVARMRIPYARIKSSADMKALLKMLELESQKPTGVRKYDTLIVDTLDAYQRIVIQERLNATNKESMSGWADWGFLDAKMMQFVQGILNLNMNVIVNLHIKGTKVGEDEDGKGGMLVEGPKLKGDMREQIAAEFDLVGLMSTFWEAENGERVLKRGIQWQPDPTRPILKDRSGQLPKWTPVNFDESDYANLYALLTDGMDDLGNSEVLDTLETEEEAAAVGPLAGGPVAPAKKTTSKPPVKKATAAAPAVPQGVAPVPPTHVGSQDAPAAPTATPTAPAQDTRPATNVPPAAKPAMTAPAASPAAVPPAPKPEIPGANPAPILDPEPEPEPVSEQAEAEAVATVQEALGGTVIEGEPVADESDTGDAVEPAEAPAEAEPAAFPKCGEGRDGEEPRAEGCGKELRVTINSGRVVDVDDPAENKDLIDIAGLKTRTWLCNGCFAAYRAAGTK